jgi:hypothetical protein
LERGLADLRLATFFNRGINRGLSVACSAVRTYAGGRDLRSAARWTLTVDPPMERREAGL